MAVATISQVRTGLKTNLDAVYKTLGWQTSAYLLSSPTPPAIDIDVLPPQYDLAMRGTYDQLEFVVRAIVPFTTDQGGQMKLDDLRDPRSATSLKVAVEADKTLGGVVSWCRVTEQSRSQIYEQPGCPPYLGCEWTVSVAT